MSDLMKGLSILEDLNEKKEEAEDIINGEKATNEAKNGNDDVGPTAEDGIGGLLGIAEGGISLDVIEEVTTSVSEERASDDTYSIGSFFSDIQSFGSDAAEMLEESKKFFTKLGAVVAIIGTCIQSGASLARAIQDDEVKTAIVHGTLLLAIQIPTTLAMLFVFLKEWVKKSVTGLLKAKEELEELASDLESFIDDTDTNDDLKGAKYANKDTNDNILRETDVLKKDLEKTKQKNNYNSVHHQKKPAPNSKKKKKYPGKKESDLVHKVGHEDTTDPQSRTINEMEEGKRITRPSKKSQTARQADRSKSRRSPNQKQPLGTNKDGKPNNGSTRKTRPSKSSTPKGDTPSRKSGSRPTKDTSKSSSKVDAAGKANSVDASQTQRNSHSPTGDSTRNGDSSPSRAVKPTPSNRTGKKTDPKIDSTPLENGHDQTNQMDGTGGTSVNRGMDDD